MKRGVIATVIFFPKQLSWSRLAKIRGLLPAGASVRFITVDDLPKLERELARLLPPQLPTFSFCKATRHYQTILRAHEQGTDFFLIDGSKDEKLLVGFNRGGRQVRVAYRHADLDAVFAAKEFPYEQFLADLRVQGALYHTARKTISAILGQDNKVLGTLQEAKEYTAFLTE